MHHPTTRGATTPSADGTPIGYTSLGSGPGLVIVHGAMQSSTSQRELASLLAERYEVHLLDRRGRGASGPYPPTPSTRIEVADLRAVLSATGSHRVLGISSGAIIAARAALVEPAIERLALFEPPISIEGSMRLELAPRLDAAIARDDLGTAMGVGMKVSEMGPPWMFGLPLPVLAAVSRRLLKRSDVRASAQALTADFQIVRESADRVRDFAAITTPTLLVSGTATRPYLRKAAAALARTIPHAQHIELPGQMHAVTQNADQFGHPDLVAPVLLDFFT